ncbi:DUF1523 family protein [Nereida sp. MMG025]|uniref:DUF1523 family protein n=1 Tax=Nereida sp. MMG025 TaxID=2909981 RepID=UPI001F1FBEEB|nr:DUF1523 family protein [Nereida sp. MMG025]MCF6445471.1 DUF1523 family protein [Nereida sp. MMG025]
MAVVKWTFWAIFWGSIALVLYYALPQKDIVQVKGTEIIRQDFSGWNSFFYAQGDSGTGASTVRDLRLINTRTDAGRPYVYRNEDTGFGWPFYFKLDSSNLQAEAQSAEGDEWYAVTHYGIRSEFLTIYPNAISMKLVEGPEVRLIPWFNIIFLTVFFAVVWAIWVRLRRFREARIDPLLEDIDESLDSTRDRVGGWFSKK